MPGDMDGLALAEIARTRHPRLPYLLVSGYSESTAQALRQGFRVLRKPFSLAELDLVVVELLGLGAQQDPGI